MAKYTPFFFVSKYVITTVSTAAAVYYTKSPPWCPWYSPSAQKDHQKKEKSKQKKKKLKKKEKALFLHSKVPFSKFN